MVSFVMYAQVTTATLSGTVSDSEEVLPAAVVKATYEPTGVVYYVTTDANGDYQFLNVAPGGPYTIEVSMIGYRPMKVTGVQLALADKNDLDILMQEEALGLEELVVTAKDMSNMASDRAGSVTSITSKSIALLPTTTRSMNDAMSLTPQATVTSNGFAVGGGNYRQSNVTVDGAAFNNSFGIGQNLPAGGSPISLDAMDQLAISITPYDVRQSGFVGGAIQATTKSGTNEWHASVYDYFQHKALQGTAYGQRDEHGNYPAELKLSDMLKNTIGATVGGPIIKNKLFFFANFEYDIDNNPGQSYMARPGDGSTQAQGGQYRRPTEERMDMMRNYLIQNYNYDPGIYQGYSFNTPDWKLFARLDWNINSANRLTVRYSYTANKYMASPSSSVSPFGSTALYDRNSYGRVSPYSLYFKNANYYQEQNYSSLAAEWNSRFFEGKGANTLRATWSHQYEPRSYEGRLFPTVDILETLEDGTRAVYTTFGIDPFTYGNLRDVNSISVVDEFSYKAENHSITAGLSFNYAKAINGYMQMGAGYYMYGSWDDFVNDAAPLAFAITHANRDDLQQQFPTLANMNLAFYAQDEVKVTKDFNLTYGLRFDLPMYPKLDNENKAFTEIFKETTGWTTGDTPKTYLNVSPRLGFNWDILGNRRIIMRGGTGYFVGNIPMVWLVSAVGNANTMQAQTLLSTPVGQESTINMHFHDNINDILKELYNGQFHQQDLKAPGSPTILAKDLKMPSTWKTSLAFDFNLPQNWKFGVEAIYNKDINSVVVTKEGLNCEKNGLVMAEGIDVRDKYTSAGLGTNPYVIHNATKSGYYASVTAKLEKSFDFGLNLMAAYTYSNAKSVNDGLGDQVTSVFSTNTYAANGSNQSGLGYSSYVAPHRVVANASYVIKEGNHASTTLALFYEGTNSGYVGTQYSYTRWTPTMSANVTGDGGAYNVIYIPTEAELDQMNFASEANKAAFNRWISENPAINAQRGHYAERGCMTMPWHNQLNFKLMQNINFADATGRKHNVEIGWDVKNVLNLLNREWGNYQYLNNQAVLAWKDGVYTYNASSCKFAPLASTASTWSMMLSLKYYF